MSPLENVFRYALDYSHEKMTDTEAVMMKDIELARAELAALRAELEKLRKYKLNEAQIPTPIPFASPSPTDPTRAEIVGTE